MIGNRSLLTTARAEALFTSDLSAHGHCTPADADAAIRRAVRIYGGTRGCAGEALARYYDCPENGLPRMRWVRQIVEAAHPSRPARLRSGALILTPSPANAA